MLNCWFSQKKSNLQYIHTMYIYTIVLHFKQVLVYVETLKSTNFNKIILMSLRYCITFMTCYTLLYFNNKICAFI